MILGHSLNTKHGIFLHIIYNPISFCLKHYSHPKACLVLILTIATIEINIISIASKRDFLFNQILKRGSTEKIDDFLERPEKISMN